MIPSSKKTDKISIVIPCLNEVRCVKKICQQLVLLNIGAIEVIIIDDGSSDDTYGEAIKVCRELEFDFKVISFTKNFGKEAALRAGLAQAEGEAVITIDADLEHPVGIIPEMVGLWKNNPDIKVINAVKESRQRESLLRKVLTYFYYIVFSFFSGINIVNQTDFKLLDKEVLDQLLMCKEKNSFYRGLVAWMNFPSIDIKFKVTSGEHRVSNWRLYHLLSYAKKTVINFSAIPLKLMTLVGFFLFVFSLMMSVDTIYKKTTGASAEGFPTIILLQLGMGSLIVFCLGLLGEYLALIYDELKNRPQYIVKKQINGKKKLLDQ